MTRRISRPCPLLLQAVDDNSLIPLQVRRHATNHVCFPCLSILSLALHYIPCMTHTTIYPSVLRLQPNGSCSFSIPALTEREEDGELPSIRGSGDPAPWREGGAALLADECHRGHEEQPGLPRCPHHALCRSGAAGIAHARPSVLAHHLPKF